MSKVQTDFSTNDPQIQNQAIKRSRQSIERILCIFMENLSFYVSLLIGTYCIIVLPEIYRFHVQMTKMNKPFYYIEMVYILIGFVISGGFYFLTPCLFGKFVDKNATEVKYRIETKEQRSERLLNYIHGLTYYLVSFVSGMLLTKGSDLRPKLFGGKFDGMDFVNTWPKDIPDLIRWYFLINLGHHLERAIILVMYKRKTNDFFTMNLHHIITVLLMLYSYLMRQLYWGIPVLLIHDMSETLFNASKFFREIKPLKKFLDITFACFWLSWFYSRILTYTIEILSPLKDTLIKPSDMIRTYFYSSVFQTVCLHVLGVLDYYWFFMISKILYIKLVSNNYKITVDGE